MLYWNGDFMAEKIWRLRSGALQESKELLKTVREPINVIVQLSPPGIITRVNPNGTIFGHFKKRALESEVLKASEISLDNERTCTRGG